MPFTRHLKKKNKKQLYHDSAGSAVSSCISALAWRSASDKHKHGLTTLSDHNCASYKRKQFQSVLAKCHTPDGGYCSFRAPSEAAHIATP